MPNFTIEHSTNVTPNRGWDAVFDALFTKAASHPTMARDAMKGRVRQLEHSYMDDGAPDKSYVHLEVALLSGREPAMLTALGNDLVNLLPDMFNVTAQCQFTAELRDMARERHFKVKVS